jgi:hypothetical protein
MTNFRVERRNDYICVNRNIVLDHRLSFEGKGIYGMLLADAIELKDVPPHIIKELEVVGYFKGEE